MFHAITEGQGFRYERREVNPLGQDLLLARVRIGTTPSGVSLDNLSEVLSKVQLPSGNSECCVTWAADGIKELLENNMISLFDTKDFPNKVTEYENKRFGATIHSKEGVDIPRFGIGRYDAQTGTIIGPDEQGPGQSEEELKRGPSWGQQSHDPPAGHAVDSSVLCRRAAVDCVSRQTKEYGPTAEAPPAKGQEAGRDELVEMAERRSKEDFDSLLGELQELSTPPRGEGIASLTAKVGEGMLGGAGLAVYGEAVADVFSSNASVLDKAAVVPGTGCAVELADEMHRGHVSAGHIALRFVEDALMVSGFWEIAVGIQPLESLADAMHQLAEQRALFDTSVFREKGMRGWEHSWGRMLDRFASDEFAASVKKKLSAHQLLVLYHTWQLSGDFSRLPQGCFGTVQHGHYTSHGTYAAQAQTTPLRSHSAQQMPTKAEA
ncbi:uncharacterized protein MAM_01178 [Metarhizium album ARSEF 1941]|uniref:Uncharacterized protein n=1 Tax=Metarhizium album (strain ARSEF 1941) TaxID=1081103 RepID=A0A0B2X4M4_METAS|nr:uncharacterized protein MAM_01178 [Metarhizium album ARSEF 1941]KHO00400.1 hypothetical protein MAM_01178 [Metarhizium album ARSEF 1941]